MGDMECSFLYSPSYNGALSKSGHSQLGMLNNSGPTIAFPISLYFLYCLNNIPSQRHPHSCIKIQDCFHCQKGFFNQEILKTVYFEAFFEAVPQVSTSNFATTSIRFVNVVNSKLYFSTSVGRITNE